MGRGFFITFEGVEGSGKSTQAALLSDALCRAGRRVVLTREPGGTRLGRELRTLLLGSSFTETCPSAELFLYMADRAQHMAEVITPALMDGKVVICDRFTDATLAYQGYGRGLSRERIALLNAEATSGRGPDLTLLMDMENVAEGLRRAVERNIREGTSGREDRFEQEEIDFHRRVRDGYRALAAAEPGRFAVFPAHRPAEELREPILAAVGEALAAAGR